MTKQEAIETIRMAIAQVEWEYPMDYSAAFDMAVEALSQPEIVRCKDCKLMKSPKGCVMFCPHLSKFVDADWFCADGERKTNITKPITPSATDYDGINVE